LRQLFYAPGGSLAIHDVPPPALADGSVLVANACSVISAGTERETVRLGTESLWRKALRRPQLVRQFVDKARQEGLAAAVGKVREKTAELKPLGYACAGRVLAVGRAVADLAPGQRVACAGAGYASHAEIVAVPRNLVAPVPPGVDLEAAAFTTLGAIAMQGLRRAELAFGETVVVLGLGLLGLLAVQVAGAAGYRVIGLDIDDERVALARRLGAEAVFNSATDDVLARVEALTAGCGADAVVIYAATPSSEPVNLALDLCRQRGRVVAVGAFGMELDRERMYRKELDFVMSTSYGPGRYDPLYEEGGVDYPIGHVRWTENRNMQAVLALLAAGQMDVQPLVSGRFPIERAPEAYAALQGDARPLALLLTYPPASQPADQPSPQAAPGTRYPVPRGRPIGVAVIGAGGFVQSVHLPALRAQSADYRVVAVVAAHGERAAVVAQQYGAPLAATDYREALAADDVHLALVGTRHDLHAPMVLDALAAGLPVFCEKPLCLNSEELAEIRAAVAETGLPVWVGFNRRYSPLAVLLKQTLDDLPRPALIAYRVNAGFVPADHWTQAPTVGGGRLIGEGCHFFDFFHFLLDRPDAALASVAVGASAVPPAGGVVARDNFVVTVRFVDGSVASLVYTALGHPDLPKERVEVHAAGASLVLDDFVTLTGHGVALPGASRANTIRLKRQDKGVAQQWREIARALRGESSRAVSFDAVCRAMELTFRADAALRGEQR
jgi:predicted dehydrogenase/threonine dehydrogenase-like Zn-dependent dehydrogenase